MSARLSSHVVYCRLGVIGALSLGTLSSSSLVLAASPASPASPTLVAAGIDRFAAGETIVRYEQSHLGLPVIGRGAAVRFSKIGVPLARHLAIASDLPSTATPSLDAAEAARRATLRLGFDARAADAHLVVWPTLDRGSRLAYAVVPRVPVALRTAPRAIVDAEDGAILEARETLVFAKAAVYATNPKTTPDVTTVDLALAPTGTTLTNPFIEAFNCIDHQNRKPVTFSGFDLDVHVCDLENVATANESGDFVYTPFDVAGSLMSRSDPFSEVSIYFHTSKAYAFFRDLQGDPEAQVVVDKPLRLVANLQLPAGLLDGDTAAALDPERPLDTFQNAFFAPATGGLGGLFAQLYGFDAGALWFGQGPRRDYAYDGDVIYHEFTHAVVDATMKLDVWHVDAYGAIDAPGAMNEGLADYFSSALAGDPDVGEYAADDLAPGATRIRTLANDDRCPSSIVGEVHADSTVFSGTLWEARSALPEASRRAFDAALYKAMRQSAGRGDLGFEDMIGLFMETLKTDLPTGATALDAAAKSRGLLPGCDRVLPFEGEELHAPDRRIGWIAPGRSAISVKGTAPGVLQIKTKPRPTTRTITVSFTKRQSPTGAGSGGDATAFRPLVLAKSGAPIVWASTGHDADVMTPAIGTGSVSADIVLPEGRTADTVYLQIASTGDADGAYDAIGITFADADGPPSPETSFPTADPSDAKAPPSDAGCAACTTGRTRGGSVLFPGGLALVVGLVVRRLRK